MLNRILLVFLVAISQCALATTNNVGPEIWITGTITTSEGDPPWPANNPIFIVSSGDLIFTPQTIGYDPSNDYGMLIKTIPGATGIVLAQYPDKNGGEITGCTFQFSINNNMNVTAIITTNLNSIITCTSSGNPNLDDFTIDITPTNP